MQNYHSIVCICIYIIGEAFTQDELEEMKSAAVDQEKGVVYYKDYVSLLVVDE